MKIKGIIFDFNGTMFYDGDIQEKAWKTFLQRKIDRMITINEFQEYVHGRNAEATFRYFLGKEFSKKEIEDLAEEKEIVYRELCLLDKNRFKLADGLPEFLDYLKRIKMPFTIATASGLNNLKFFFEQLNLSKWFDINDVIYDDGIIKGKPEPEIYLKASNKICVPINECMIFEDAKSGILSAQRAGAYKIIGVASMINKKEISNIDGVNEVIKDYTKAIYLLKSN